MLLFSLSYLQVNHYLNFPLIWQPHFHFLSYYCLISFIKKWTHIFWSPVVIEWEFDHFLEPINFLEDFISWTGTDLENLDMLPLEGGNIFSWVALTWGKVSLSSPSIESSMSTPRYLKDLTHGSGFPLRLRFLG